MLQGAFIKLPIVDGVGWQLKHVQCVKIHTLYSPFHTHSCRASICAHVIGGHLDTPDLTLLVHVVVPVSSINRLQWQVKDVF